MRVHTCFALAGPSGSRTKEKVCEIFEKTMMNVKLDEICSLEKKIDETKNIIDDDDDDDDLQIDPPYTSPTRVFIALFMHKTMGLEPWFLCTQFCMVVSYII